jgi:thiol-disulfide isomerase/thioredoxin
MSASRLLALIVALAGIGVGLFLWLSLPRLPKPPPALARLTANRKLAGTPDLVLTDAAGFHHALPALKGHYVLINVWASWCGPCVAELPALARLAGALPDSQLSVLAVDEETGANGIAAPFLAAHGAQLLVPYADPGMEVMRAFHVYGFPTTILIDPDGRQIARAVGPANWGDPASIDYFRKLTEPRTKP